MGPRVRDCGSRISSPSQTAPLDGRGLKSIQVVAFVSWEFEAR
jgi:hypothetical protein